MSTTPRTETTSITQPLSTGKRLVNRLDAEPFALSFSGQGYAWLPNLQASIAAGAGTRLAGHLKQAEEILEPLADDLAAAFPHGFAPLEWAAAANSPRINLADSAISTPGIVTAQVGVLEALAAF